MRSLLPISVLFAVAATASAATPIADVDLATGPVLVARADDPVGDNRRGRGRDDATAAGTRALGTKALGSTKRRGADDPTGVVDQRRGQGADDPATGVIDNRRGRGADNPPGTRRGHGADDPANHG